jgi:hypothetical protein
MSERALEAIERSPPACATECGEQAFLVAWVARRDASEQRRQGRGRRVEGNGDRVADERGLGEERPERRRGVCVTRGRKDARRRQTRCGGRLAGR